MQASVASLVELLAFTVLPRVLKIAFFIALGVSLANLLVAFGLIERIGRVARYLTEPANLPTAVGTAVLTTTASTTAGYGMLAEFREAGVLDDRATLVAVTINTFFGFAQHIFTFYAPVLIPILGLRVGLTYVGARAAISLAITLTGIAAGAVLLSDRNVDRDALSRVDTDAGRTADADERVTDGGERASDGGERAADDDGEPATGSSQSSPSAQSTRDVVEDAVRAGLSKTWDILPRLAVVYAVVVVLTTYYDVTRVTSVAEPLTGLLGLPGAAVPVVAVFAIDTTNGALVIAPLLGDVFTVRTAVATMLIGGIVSFAVSTFKRSIPFQFGIWGADFGIKVVLVNTVLKVVFIGIAVALLLPPL